MNPGVQDEYGPVPERMRALARNVPGYISHKGFIAEDGERVAIVEFEPEEDLEGWRNDPDHCVAKRRGFESFYSEFKFQICSLVRAKLWSARAKSSAG